MFTIIARRSDRKGTREDATVFQVDIKGPGIGKVRFQVGSEHTRRSLWRNTK